jgi:hypothetical protein
MRRFWLIVLAGCAPVETELLPNAGDGGCAASPTQLGGQCAPALAAARHRFALCTCEPLTVGGLNSVAFDSTGAAGPPVASLGTNGAFLGNGEINVGGALWAGGAVTINTQLETTGSLRAGGALSARGAEVEVHGDAFVDGDVSSGVHVEGTLHVPSNATVDPLVQAQVVREPVTIDPPCDCGAPALGAEISAARAHNDDSLIGLDSGALTGGTLDLPCGVYYIDSVTSAALFTLRVHGLVKLVVAQDLVLQGGLSVALDGGAELDLVVGGSINASGAASIGSPASPPRVRVWVASDRTLVFDGNPSLHLVLTAPAAAISAPEGLTVEGSILARQFSAGRTVLHYDRAILASGSACGTPAEAPVP